MGGKPGGVGKRGVGSSKCKKTHKAALRTGFELRHIDQVRFFFAFDANSAAGVRIPTPSLARLSSLSPYFSSFLSRKAKRRAISYKLESETTQKRSFERERRDANASKSPPKRTMTLAAA
jgi:hypothetical protein